MFTPWSLRTWPKLLWQVKTSFGPGFQHLSTSVIYTEGGANKAQGQTLWAAHAARGDAGMAWDWVQISQGVVAIADPLSLETNLRLLSASGEPLCAHQSTLILNQFVRDLPWQYEVHRVLSATLN
jgi:hypothetical protein